MIRRLPWVMFGLPALWAAGFLWFVAFALPDRVEDDHTRTDAIVVLTGGSERLATGMGLLQARLAERLFVSGVHRGVDMSDLIRQGQLEPPPLSGAVELGHVADDTVGNAAETALWVADRHLSSIRLVTGAYHMPRALVEFRQAMPGLLIVPHPVFPDAVKSREWWRWPGTALLLATEFNKYVAASLRHWFLPRKPAS